MKKVIAFDLDGTLTESKSTVEDRMSNALGKLLKNFHVCVISGGKFTQFQKQLLANLKIEPAKFEKLHLMPTCGTRYYTYNVTNTSWEQVYAEDLTDSQKQKIIKTLMEGAKKLNYLEPKTYGEIIEDRGSQITFSALGQDIVAELGAKGLKLKKAWDPSGEKKQKLRDYVAKRIPEFEVRTGGESSVDVTKPGIDKAYGMQKLMGTLKLSKNDILFIGDRLNEGGNDYPVKAMGIDSLEISHWQEAVLVVETINCLV
jgi:HAD superfamily hydrolase (TIGR01484 family)